MTIPDIVSNLFVESLKLSAKQREVLDVINQYPRGITAARIAAIMGTTVNTLRGHLEELLAQDAIRAEAPNVGSRGRPALVYSSRVPDNRAIALEYITLVRVLAQYVAETAEDPQAAAYEIGRNWARQISAEPYDESEMLIRLTQMGFDPVPVAQANNQDITAQSPTHHASAVNNHHNPPPHSIISANSPSIELRSCPFLDPHQDTPTTVCDMHRGMLAAREGTNGQRFVLIPHHDDALCHVAITRSTTDPGTKLRTLKGDADDQ